MAEQHEPKTVRCELKNYAKAPRVIYAAHRTPVTIQPKGVANVELDEGTLALLQDQTKAKLPGVRVEKEGVETPKKRLLTERPTSKSAPPPQRAQQPPEVGATQQRARALLARNEAGDVDFNDLRSEAHDILGDDFPDAPVSKEKLVKALEKAAR
jgi:hypothetical protein